MLPCPLKVMPLFEFLTVTIKAVSAPNLKFQLRFQQDMYKGSEGEESNVSASVVSGRFPATWVSAKTLQ
jgi:hypothetical protein